MSTPSQPDNSAVLKSATEVFPVMLAETSRAWRALMDQRLRHLGLSQAKWLALLHIYRGGTDMTQKELASRLGVEGPTLTALLDRLMRDDYILRRESPTDRRAKTVHLTAKAKQLMKKIIAVAAQLRGELFAEIPLKDLQVCIRTFQSIQQTAENLSRQQHNSK